jgi:hypothetical protein
MSLPGTLPIDSSGLISPYVIAQLLNHGIIHGSDYFDLRSVIFHETYSFWHHWLR